MRFGSVAFSLLTLFILSGAAPSWAETYRIATSVQKDGTAGRLIEEAALNIEQRTDGRVRFKIFHNGLLGDQLQYLQQVQRGVIDAGLVNSAALESVIPEFGVVNMPYLFRSADEYRAVMSSPLVHETLFASATRHHFAPLAFLSSDFRSIYTTVPVRDINDLKGLKLRSIPSKTYVEMLQRFGATPVLMPFGELYSGLQQGVVDGAEGGLAGLYQAKFGEVAKYVLVTEQTRLTDFVVTSLQFPQKMAPEDWAIVEEEFRHVSLKSVDFAEANEAETVALAKEEMGVHFIQVDKAPFIKAVQPMYRETLQDPKQGVILEAIFRAAGRDIPQ
ncbi:TRAP transporter substrate-binding protein DctP [Gilvimarinus agarilyticus]|uniref:TRAP transporter substrate-binding protein DctP n=1 Tax=unclassified Gilvimarinus TaxID=2642066 RepID=UPI001C09E1EF|nr:MULTISPECIES: TRAP transporter substrate-binding protein DctP [unclassified Gilvimarinus]MBU2884457.1 TRAP transporter substrate-binding protein DctP [Gilvimarinus agarilyticus]MDO6569593.1 TRAP transporter substrate-binding protein DctP [Gilvimarinus sp. 2_MG-2023]MDO6748082.1 TRAP transporter substrate-binding protein DctP [Gilvimarinus sp. 1_MG-2023]